MVGLAKLVIAPDCGSGGRGFDSHISPHKHKTPVLVVGVLFLLSDLWERTTARNAPRFDNQAKRVCKLACKCASADCSASASPLWRSKAHSAKAEGFIARKEYYHISFCPFYTFIPFTIFSSFSYLFFTPS